MGESVLKKIFPTRIYYAPGGRRLNRPRATNARFSRITSSRPLKPGMLVSHRIHGTGTIVGEWGPVLVFYGEGSRASCSCDGIYDCRFGLKPHQYLHCCRIEYLRRVQ
jgi:hypothetical protein